MRPAYREEGIADAGAGTESQRGLDMLDRDVVLADPIPEVAADEPATCKIRVEGQGAVHQRHHRADVLAEVSQRLAAFARMPGSSPATSSARLAKSVAFARSASGSSLRPSITSRKQQTAA